MEVEDFDYTVKAGGKKRGRPPMVNKEIENSFAKTGIIRKPVYLVKEGETDSEAAAGSQSSSEVKEAVAKKYISVEPFTPRGPKPGQKRKPYKKRKSTKTKKVDETMVQKEKEKPEVKKRRPRKSQKQDESAEIEAPSRKKVKFDDSCLEESTVKDSEDQESEEENVVENSDPSEDSGNEEPITDEESEEGSRLTRVFDDAETERAVQGLLEDEPELAWEELDY